MTATTISKPSETEARLKETLVLIQLMYERLVAAGVPLNDPIRQMAGNLLYAGPYAEWVKEIDKR